MKFKRKRRNTAGVERVLHSFAYDSVTSSKVTIKDAVKGERYVDFRNDTLIVKAGEINRKHFSYLPNHYREFNSFQSAKYETGTAGTTHTVLIQKIGEQGYLDIENIRFSAHTVVYERATIPNSNLIPDITFLDEDGEILLCIEVAVTHFCNEQKIEELRKLEIPTIELSYGRQNDNIDEPKRIRFIGSKGFEEIEVLLRNRERNSKIDKEYKRVREEEEEAVERFLRESRRASESYNFEKTVEEKKNEILERYEYDFRERAEELKAEVEDYRESIRGDKEAISIYEEEIAELSNKTEGQ